MKLDKIHFVFIFATQVAARNRSIESIEHEKFFILPVEDKLNSLRNKIEESLHEIRDEHVDLQTVITDALWYVKDDRREILNAIDYGSEKVQELSKAAADLGDRAAECAEEIKYEINDIANFTNAEFHSCMKSKIKSGIKLLKTLGENLKFSQDVTEDISFEYCNCDTAFGILAPLLNIVTEDCKDLALARGEERFAAQQFERMKIIEESRAYRRSFSCELMVCTASGVAQASIKSTEIIHKLGLCLIDKLYVFQKGIVQFVQRKQ